MRVVILGAGGVGSYLGALLARAGHRVLLVDPWEDHVEAINRRGLQVFGEETFVVRVDATAEPVAPDSEPIDLFILATKNTGNPDTLTLVRELKPAAATSVQNGFNTLDGLTHQFGEDHIFGMCTLISGSLLGPGEVKGFKGERATFLGELDGRQSHRIATLSEQLVEAGLRVVVPDHIESVHWTKLAWWIPLVALPALTRLTWGEAFAQRDVATLFVEVERECAEVASANGHPPRDYPGIEILRRLHLTREEAVEDVLAMGRRFVAEGNGSYEVAMLLDFKRRRHTEAANTIGAIVASARTRGIPVPTTDCIWRLIRSIEATF